MHKFAIVYRSGGLNGKLAKFVRENEKWRLRLGDPDATLFDTPLEAWTALFEAEGETFSGLARLKSISYERDGIERAFALQTLTMSR